MAALKTSGAVVHPVRMHRLPAHPRNFEALWHLRRLIASVGPDVVHGHSAVGGALARLAAASTGVPVVYTPNALPRGRPALTIEKALGRLTAKVVAVSASEARLAVELGVAPEGRIAVVPNGIDLCPPPGPDLDLRRLAGAPPDAPLVGTVVRLVPQKAPETFVAICARVAIVRPDAHFLLIGSGPLQPELDAAVERAGLGLRWHQLPYVERVSSVLAQLDVFVLSSAFEGGPYTPLEAMRAGTPLVLSDVVGNRDVIEPGVSGLIAPFDDPDALARHVISLLDDPELGAALATEAHLRLEQRFDVRAMGEAMVSLYGKVAQG